MNSCAFPQLAVSSAIMKVFLGTRARSYCAHFIGLVFLALLATWPRADARENAPRLTVHEWGTFTAVAGSDGKAVEWTPFTGPTDLPGFVEHFSDLNFKVGLRGTIRMETPVLYFYSPRDLTVSVNVAFAKGIISEWYPHAVRVHPTEVLRNTNLSQLQADGSITWDDVVVSPNLTNEFPRESRGNRYYAARQTSSTPLGVKTTAGEQQEKFLFYRGVSAASVPVSAEQTTDGKLLVKSLSEGELGAVILFERRGKRVGYRIEPALGSEMILDPPALTGDVDSLARSRLGSDSRRSRALSR